MSQEEGASGVDGTITSNHSGSRNSSFTKVARHGSKPNIIKSSKFDRPGLPRPTSKNKELLMGIIKGKSSKKQALKLPNFVNQHDRLASPNKNLSLQPKSQLLESQSVSSSVELHHLSSATADV